MQASDQIYSLGQFVPQTERWDTQEAVDKLMAEFDVWLTHALKKEFNINVEPNFTEVRRPGNGYSALNSPKDNTQFGWHQDLAGPYRWLVLWSTGPATEIRKFGSNQIHQPNPFEVVMFQNEAFEHRTPPMRKRQAKHRWFARTTIANETLGLS